MARRAQDSGGTVNLFPFLSILVCIIGCLTLIIVVINLIAMDQGEGRTSDEVERAREYVLIKKEKEQKQEELDEMRQLIEDIIQKNRDVIATRDKLAALKEMLESKEELDESREELIAQFNLLRGTNEKLLEDEKFLREEIRKKEEEIKARKLPPEPAALMVRPSGSGSSMRPFFAEVSERGLYLHTSLSAEPAAIPVAALSQSKDFISLLDTVASATQNRLVFLVRGNPKAVETLQEATDLVTAYNQNKGTTIIPGKLPLPGDGKVDLRLFAPFLQP